jgi:hypothetical protein
MDAMTSDSYNELQYLSAVLVRCSVANGDVTNTLTDTTTTMIANSRGFNSVYNSTFDSLA